MPSSSTLIPHGAVAGAGEARRPGHPREHASGRAPRRRRSADRSAPRRRPTRAWPCRSPRARSAGSASAATACGVRRSSPAPTAGSPSRAPTSSSSSGMWISSGLTWTPQSIPCMRANRPTRASAPSILRRSSGRAGVSAWLERPRPGRPGRCAQHPAVMRCTRSISAGHASTLCASIRATSSSPIAGASSPLTPRWPAAPRRAGRGSAARARRARSRLKRHLPSTRCATTPASRRTRKWCEQVDLAIGRSKLPQVCSLPSASWATIRSRTGSLSAWRIVARSSASRLAGTSGSTAGVPTARPRHQGRSASGTISSGADLADLTERWPVPFHR